MVCHVLLKWIIMWLLRRNDLEESTSRDQWRFVQQRKKLKKESDNHGEFAATNEDIFF